jgi:hypothetical protein
MGNQVGGPNRKPRRGGQRGFWLGVWGCGHRRRVSIATTTLRFRSRNFRGNAARHTSKAGVALQISDPFRCGFQRTPRVNLPLCD